MAEITFPTRTNAVDTATAGKDYLLYVNTGATEAAPTWTIIGGQRGADLGRSSEEIDASHKTSGGYKKTIPGLKSWSIDLEAVYLIGDAGARFLEAAWEAGKQVHIKFEYPDRSYRTGWAALNECNLSTPHDDVASLKGKLNGDGPLSALQSAPTAD